MACTNGLRVENVNENMRKQGAKRDTSTTLHFLVNSGTHRKSLQFNAPVTLWIGSTLVVMSKLTTKHEI